MKLTLADGSSFVGHSFGADAAAAGEVVFNTGMTGYPEALTDPSYRGQILVLTYPLQGNYGVADGPFESDRIQVAGLVVTRHANAPSHYDTRRSLGTWLREAGVPAVEGIDTRTLTRRLREHGTIEGTLGLEEAGPAPSRVDMKRVAESACAREVVRFAGSADAPTVLVVDTGAKESIIRSLVRRGVSVIRAPFYGDWLPFLDEADGVLLTNGPGDPTDLAPLLPQLRLVLSRQRPLFGVCLGHQLLALAAGAETYKLPYGHRSQNQPVRDLATGRLYVTSQNHGYAVRAESLPKDWQPWFVNLHDDTNEGIRHASGLFRAVQFHPEAAPGPHDAAHLFDDFLATVGEKRTTSPRRSR